LKVAARSMVSAAVPKSAVGSALIAWTLPISPQGATSNATIAQPSMLRAV